MRKTILVLEDSRKVGFGGGQKGSLEMIQALMPCFNLIITDSVANSRFAQGASQRTGSPVVLLRSFGKIVNGDKASFSIGPLEILLFPLLTLWNLGRLYLLLRSSKLQATNCILYAPSKKTLVLAWTLAKVTGIPLVYHARNFDNRNSIFFKPLEWILRETKLVICVSKAVLQNLQAPQGIHLYNPIRLQNSTKPKSIEGKSPIIVAAFASLLPWKGLEYLIQAHSQLKFPEKVRIWIFGTGPELSKLTQLASPGVELKGFTDQVDSLLRDQIDLICMPSISEEAFGRVPMEGYSFGIPAIVTNIGAQAEITLDGETGVLVPVQNATAIADAVDHFLQNPQLYATMSANALRRAQEFDLNAFERKVREIFQNL
jgi:glycosyltransferase involved in cell wall biosynthesis